MRLVKISSEHAKNFNPKNMEVVQILIKNQLGYYCFDSNSAKCCTVHLYYDSDNIQRRKFTKHLSEKHEITKNTVEIVPSSKRPRQELEIYDQQELLNHIEQQKNVNKSLQKKKSSQIVLPGSSLVLSKLKFHKMKLCSVHILIGP